MLRIAGQTAGPIGLNFFVDTHGCCRLKKFENIFFFKFYKKKFFSTGNIKLILEEDCNKMRKMLLAFLPTLDFKHCQKYVNLNV